MYTIKVGTRILLAECRELVSLFAQRAFLRENTLESANKVEGKTDREKDRERERMGEHLPRKFQLIYLTRKRVRETTLGNDECQVPRARRRPAVMRLV